MKKTYKLKDLDCANCAAKMQNAIAKLDGVQDVNVNFMGQRMTIELVDARADEIMRQVVETVKRIEPDCVVVI
ncbi:cation transporter [Eubacteriales bacterium OttesenSCG-928-N13]|nr:cation transporter [Eubacteriales bacterium OttesenSCG-928-N13]